MTNRSATGWLVAVVTGLLLGWLSAWLFWRRLASDQDVALDGAGTSLDTTRAELLANQQSLRNLQSESRGLHAENDRLRAELRLLHSKPDASARSTADEPAIDTPLSRTGTTETLAAPVVPSTKPAGAEPPADGSSELGRDPLVEINGVGPVYERKLVEAGITTFTQLAALTPEQIRAIIQPAEWQRVDASAWIAEAGQRARQGREDADQRERG
jgi:predicted flap endonuclease-1-like 5' DNA nuclease